MSPEDVASRDELADFVDGLLDEYRSGREAWENQTLPHYLEALGRYLRDLPGWCRNNSPGTDPDQPQWRLFAVALAGATVYE